MSKFALLFFGLFTIVDLASAKMTAKVEVVPGIKFEKKDLSLGTTKLRVEIADSPEKLGRGLMYRKTLGENEGMLFIFPKEETQSFWMKNTFVPLSIGFFDANKKLVEFFDMDPVKSEMEMNPPTYQSKASAMYALEVPKGWFQKHKIPLGTVFQLK